jgi:hypothetical protein
MTEDQTIRAWALASPDVACGQTGRLPQSVRDAYYAAHPDSSPAAADSTPAPAGDDTEPELADYVVSITAWDAGWEAPLAQATAGLIGAVESATIDRCLTILRGLESCRGLREGIAAIEGLQ